VFLHHAVDDDYSQLVYSEQLPDERKGDRRVLDPCPGVLRPSWLSVQSVMTDNGSCYRSSAFAKALGPDIKHRKTRPYRPQTKAK